MRVGPRWAYLGDIADYYEEKQCRTALYHHTCIIRYVVLEMIAENRNSPITTRRRFLRKKTWKRVCPVTKRLVLTRSVSRKCTVQYSVYRSTVLAVEQVKISNTR